MPQKILFTSESVSEGHPDKVCDQISDAVLQEALKQDKNARVACEVYATGNYILIGGEITCNSSINYDEIARNVLKDIGYDKDELGTNYKNAVIDIKVKNQSSDISLGVSQKSPEEVGAGDQGIMFGYATDETEGYMPLAISIAHKLVREATRQRKSGEFKGARPDMKSQVTIDYTNPNNIKIDTVDNFQGREAEVIIVDFVRSYGKLEGDKVKLEARNLDFYFVKERINVAISRAKAKLIIVGSFKKHYLKKDTIKRASLISKEREALENIYNSITLILEAGDYI